MDEALFEHLLSFHEPKDAARLSCLSRLFKRWVRESKRWKVWTHEDFPSCKLEPAFSLLERAYGEESGRSYRDLYTAIDTDFSIDRSLFESGELLILLDVRVGDASILSRCWQGCAKPMPGGYVLSQSDAEESHCHKSAKIVLREAVQAQLPKIERTNTAGSLWDCDCQEPVTISKHCIESSIIFLRASDGIVHGRLSTMVCKVKIGLRACSKEWWRNSGVELISGSRTIDGAGNKDCCLALSLWLDCYYYTFAMLALRNDQFQRVQRESREELAGLVLADLRVANGLKDCRERSAASLLGS